MAAIQQLRIASMASSFLPRFASPAFASSFRSTLLYTNSIRQSSFPTWPVLAIAIPAVWKSIPGILGDIWEGILRAVPKKKTSHMKKRHRQMAGKALKDVTALNKCPGCGFAKKMHTLCPHCMGSMSPISTPMLPQNRTNSSPEIQGMFPNTSKPGDTAATTF